MLTEAYRLHYKEVSVKIATLKISEGDWRRTLGILSAIMGEETLHLGEDRIGSLLFDVQNDENSSFKVVNVLESNSILLDAFDEVIGSF